MEDRERQGQFHRADVRPDIDTRRGARRVSQLMTLRSNGQFNTTVYSYDDRFRGIDGTRDVVLMHRPTWQRLGLADGRRSR